VSIDIAEIRRRAVCARSLARALARGYRVSALSAAPA